ncbi:MAG: nitroreductase family protein [Muribaculaceae bacterium]|nr:nitroreductase family protein [Muribaculaceae bacterium]
MKDFHQLLLNRRSYRKYKEQELKAEDVKLILEAALVSPSSKSTMGWEFIVVEDKDTLEKLSLCKEHGARPIAGCKLAVVVTADTTKSDVWIEDASIASVIMQLQAADLGLGSCWIQVRQRFTADGISSEDYVREMFGIPEQFAVLSVMTFGYKDEERKPYDPEKTQWEKVHIGKW